MYVCTYTFISTLINVYHFFMIKTFQIISSSVWNAQSIARVSSHPPQPLLAPQPLAALFLLVTSQSKQ